MRRIDRTSLACALAAAVVCLAPGTAGAQEPHVHPASPPQASAPNAWQWSGDGNAFFGYNYQQRQFADFSAWESQNWLMGTGTRAIGGGHLVLEGMLSLEPFTMKAAGSPQLFQTGESYQNVPLVNQQHPHDLFMEFGATYRVKRARSSYYFGAD